MDMSDFILPTIDEIEAAKIVTCTIVGVLEESDLAALAMGQPLGGDTPAANAASAPPLPRKPSEPMNPKRLREKHHSVARLIAQGLSQELVAELSGYTSSYLSVLLGSPSMQELVSFYRAQNGNAAEVIGEKLRAVGLEAVSKLANKMENNDLDVGELLGIAKLGLDRSGHGPSQKIDHNHQHVVVDIGELEKLNREARRESAERISSRQRALPAPDEGEA